VGSGKLLERNIQLPIHVQQWINLNQNYGPVVSDFICSGVAAIVTAEITSLPACKFQVQVQRG
jgi:uncharacterized protein YbcC (UPF0753/DUF2309 family)